MDIESDINAPLDDERQTEKDVSYSPASDRETAERQKSPSESPATDDVDAGGVKTLPGTGGPDDPGEVSTESGEINLPRDRGPH
jgi:hypothetical protein